MWPKDKYKYFRIIFRSYTGDVCDVWCLWHTHTV